MPPSSLQSCRLALKRAFIAYYLDLISPNITDPTAAFAAAKDYLSALLRQLGPAEFMRRLDDETTRLAGETEQDLRHRFRDREAQPDYTDLEDRLRECLEHGLGQLDTSLTRPRYNGSP